MDNQDPRAELKRLAEEYVDAACACVQAKKSALPAAAERSNLARQSLYAAIDSLAASVPAQPVAPSEDEAWAFARMVWNEMDRKSMPGIYMQMVTEAVAKHYPQRAAPVSQEVAHAERIDFVAPPDSSPTPRQSRAA